MTGLSRRRSPHPSRANGLNRYRDSAHFEVGRYDSHNGPLRPTPEDRGLVNLTQEIVMSTTTISPLRQRMIEDMTARKFGPASQRSHIESCERFAAFLKRSPATATPDDVRLFQLDLIESGLSIPNRNRIMSGAKFLFRVTLRRLDLVSEVFHMKEPSRVPLILSQDETKRLLAMAGCLRDRLLLSLGYGAGLRAGEVTRLRVKHIDRAQNIICVEQSKGRKDRLVMLSPETLGLLREWWKARPTRWDTMVSSQDRLLFPGRK